MVQEKGRVDYFGSYPTQNDDDEDYNLSDGRGAAKKLSLMQTHVGHAEVGRRQSIRSAVVYDARMHFADEGEDAVEEAAAGYRGGGDTSTTISPGSKRR